MRRGVTLVDLVVTLAIMSIVAAIAIPKFAAAIDRRALLNSAYRVAADCRRARGAAIDGATTASIQFTAGESSYSVQITNGPLAGTKESVAINVSPLGAAVVSTSGISSDLLQFDAYGNTSKDSGILLGRGKQRVTVSVAAAGGKVSVGSVSYAGALATDIKIDGVVDGGSLKSAGAGGAAEEK